MAQLLDNVYQQFFDANGVPLSGGKLTTYAAGTTTPLGTFKDKAETSANTNPIILDANGVARIWIAADAYKFVLSDANDNVIWTVDNVQSINNGSITTVKVADAAIETVKIKDLAVTTAKIADAAIETIKIKDAAVTTAKIGDGQITPQKFANDFDFSQLNIIEMVVRNPGEFLRADKIEAIPQVPWLTPTLTVPPATGPAGNALSVAWSPNWEFLAVGHETSPYLSIYQRSGTRLLKLPNPTTLPAGACRSVAFSPNGEYLLVGCDVSPFNYMLKRYGNQFALAAFPLGLPLAAQCVAFSPNGQFVAATALSSVTPLVCIGLQKSAFSSPVISTVLPFNIVGSGSPTISDVNNAFNDATVRGFINTNFTNLKNSIDFGDSLYGNSGVTITASPGGNSAGLAWSPDSSCMIVAVKTSPFIAVYTFDGATLTKISGPVTPPPGATNGVAISPNGKYVCMTHDTAPYVTLYSKAGTVLTKLSDPATLPAGAGGAAPSWSPNGRYLAIPHAVAPFVTIYEQSGDTFTKLADSTSPLSAAGVSANWSANGEYLALAQYGSPYLGVMRSAGVFPKNALLFMREVFRV